MRKNIKIMSLLAALFMLMPAFTSCDNDDDDEPVETDHVVGSYTGNMVATVTAMGHVYDEIVMPETYTVRISAQDGVSGRVTVVLPECSYTPPGSSTLETIPSLTIDNVKVEDEGNGLYSLDKDEYTCKVGETQYRVEIFDYDKDDKDHEDGTTIAGRDIRLVYSIVPGTMPGFINFTFTGTLK